MENVNYQEQLDKALSQLRQLEIDKALSLFYQLLLQYPKDLALFEHIYNIEKRKKTNDGFNKICHLLFDIDSMADNFHLRVIEVYIEYKNRLGIDLESNSFSARQIFNLFYHLGQTNFQDDINQFHNKIKKQLADHKFTPNALLLYSEQLAGCHKLTQAIEELEYLMIYYTEASTQQAAEKLISELRRR